MWLLLYASKLSNKIFFIFISFATYKVHMLPKNIYFKALGYVRGTIQEESARYHFLQYPYIHVEIKMLIPMLEPLKMNLSGFEWVLLIYHP